VQPGDLINSSVIANSDRSFTMKIQGPNTKEISTTYNLERGQKSSETTVYFVLEHQPITCAAYPSDGSMQFENIVVEVAGQAVTPSWLGLAQEPACDSKVDVVDSQTIKFSWNTSQRNQHRTNRTSIHFPHPKWFNPSVNRPDL